MRKAALLYNLDSGSTRKRLHELEAALAVLRGAGVDANLVPTESRTDGGEQARAAIESGCDTIFACGGDGTIHNIMQVVANTSAALAILPMGTANALGLTRIFSTNFTQVRNSAWAWLLIMRRRGTCGSPIR